MSGHLYSVAKPGFRVILSLKTLIAYLVLKLVIKSLQPTIFHSLLITEMNRYAQVDICKVWWVIEVKNFSVLTCLLRITAYVLWFVDRLKNGLGSQSGTEEMSQALLEARIWKRQNLCGATRFKDELPWGEKLFKTVNCDEATVCQTIWILFGWRGSNSL